MHKFILRLTSEDVSLIQNDRLECFIVETSLPESEIKNLVKAVKSKEKLVLVMGENACALCQKYEADDVLIDLSKSEHCAKDVNFARKQIGEKALGVISRGRRHESMIISECEPDFVAFKAWEEGIEHTKELVSWYNEMFLIQSAVVLEEPIEKPKEFDCDIIIGSASDYKNFCC